MTDDLEIVTPDSAAAWRAWLESNHTRTNGIWLRYWKLDSGYPSLIWSDAVDEALCFGWIDSKSVAIDDVSYRQWFAPRKARSVWSRVNKEKLERLALEGRLMPAGLAAIERAKSNGTWETLDAAWSGEIPADLDYALQAAGPTAVANFAAFPPGWKRILFEKVLMAKRPETRAKRITEIVNYAIANQRRP